MLHEDIGEELDDLPKVEKQTDEEDDLWMPEIICSRNCSLEAECFCGDCSFTMCIKHKEVR